MSEDHGQNAWETLITDMHNPHTTPKRAQICTDKGQLRSALEHYEVMYIDSSI